MSNFDIDSWIARSVEEDSFKAELCGIAEFKESKGSLVPFPKRFSSTITEHLIKLGYKSLYQHQADAVNHALDHKPVMVTTGTNSGKSLCYMLPAFQAILAEPMARAMLIFPTKALAQDQAQRLEALKPASFIRIGVYDGDTPKSQRSSLRKSCHIIITNPDMLHLGILPNHEAWADFFRNLRVIGLDELHVYRGIFGSHTANVLRRLQLLCQWHGSRPDFVGCSGTIAEGGVLFYELTGKVPNTISRDESHQGRRKLALWNPLQLGPNSWTDPLEVTTKLASSLLGAGARFIAFSRSRREAEMVLFETRKALAGKDIDPKRFESYRAGYGVDERRQLERQILDGTILGLSATNALELGVDIGGLDAVVINGYPGTLTSFWQQAGRAGRGAQPGLINYVAHEDPLEQYLIRSGRLLGKSIGEKAVLNPNNPTVVAAHLQCAAHERGLGPDELEQFGNDGAKVAASLDESGQLRQGAGRYFYNGVESPASKVSLRGAGGTRIKIVCGDQLLGEIDLSRAYREVHEGAVYLQRGSMFLVKSLNVPRLEAQLEPTEPHYYTLPDVVSAVNSLHVLEEASEKLNISLHWVEITEQVMGYRMLDLTTRRALGSETLDLPIETYETVAVRLGFDQPEPAKLLEFMGGVHGLEHVLTTIAPAVVGCDRHDLGSAWTMGSKIDGNPEVWIYDQIPGGVGLCHVLFQDKLEWMEAALELLDCCSCRNGCPSCLYDSRCRTKNEPLNKRATIQYLEAFAKTLRPGRIHS